MVQHLVKALRKNLWQYRTKIVRQMCRQIFRQMKQKAREYLMYSRAFL